MDNSVELTGAQSSKEILVMKATRVLSDDRAPEGIHYGDVESGKPVATSDSISQIFKQ